MYRGPRLAQCLFSARKCSVDPLIVAIPLASFLLRASWLV